METPDSSGQRLRWWQDQPPQATPKWYAQSAPGADHTSAVSLTPEPLELEDELEAEALRRAALEQDVVITEGSYDNLQSHSRRMFAWIIGLALLFYVPMGVISQSWFLALIPLIYIAEYFILTAVMRKTFRGRKFAVKTSSLGLTLDLPYYHIGPIFWNEVKSVRVVNMLLVQVVQVRLKDPKTTLKRALVMRKHFGSRLTRWSLEQSPIEIQARWFGGSATGLAAQIANFRPAVIEKKK